MTGVQTCALPISREILPLLELKEFHLLLVPNIFREVFLQKYPLEGFPSYSLTFSLPTLASVLPPIPSFFYWSVGAKSNLLLLTACHLSKDFLNLPYPILSTIEVVSSIESKGIVSLETIQPLILDSSCSFSSILVSQSLG